MRGRHVAVSERFVGEPLLALIEHTEPEPSMTPVDETTPIFGLVNWDGSANDRLPVTAEELRSLYAEMIEARCFDTVSTTMHHIGRLVAHTTLRGQEGAQIGAGASLRPADWVVATHADPVLAWRAGYPWKLVILWRTGDERGGQAPEGVNILPPTPSSGSHMIDAVGLGFAEKLKGSERIALVSMGDGDGSAGYFHEAMNLAVAFATPTVFFCQSSDNAPHPTTKQGHFQPIADLAREYGMPGVRVDGRDVVAVLVTVQEATQRARRGGGPSLIEAVMDHSGSPKAAEERSPNRRDFKSNGAEEGDPLERIRRLLERAGAWTQEWHDGVEQEASRRIDEAVAWVESQPLPTPGEMIEKMYATPTAPLVEQLSKVDE